MNERVLNQLKKFKEMAKAQETNSAANIQSKAVVRPDGLSMAIRNKKDADTFMAELDAITRQAK